MNEIRVKAAPGIKVPKEGRPREYITDTEAEIVPASVYYLRIVAEGDLIKVDDKAGDKTTAKAKGTE
ncbi:DUF2635 domain-containing protein [Neisseriaceae bacterium JH1-16]|nr:DUF2635 domain-containing protein [Neisseriaceae bacterium JH1-16]